MIKACLAKLMAGCDLTRNEAEGVMAEIMDGEATSAQMAGFLTALRLKGECADEVAGCTAAMRQRVIRVEPLRQDLVDTAGTGGDGAGTFNISTTAAFVVAGAGLAVAKHGNRAVSGQCGSADVLEQLGVNLDLTPTQTARCIDEVGIGFLFAPRLHPAMKNVAAVRHELGVRTVFNILGPLANPARAAVQIIGTFEVRLVRLMAEVLLTLGCRAAFVFHSSDGLDELTTSGVNYVARVCSGTIVEERFDAAELDLPSASRHDLLGGSPRENARITRSILAGSERGPRRDVVLLNASAAIFAAGAASGLREGMKRAAEAIDSGRALQALDSLTALSSSMCKSSLAA